LDRLPSDWRAKFEEYRYEGHSAFSSAVTEYGNFAGHREKVSVGD
jgi:hypothetical protein